MGIESFAVWGIDFKKNTQAEKYEKCGWDKFVSKVGQEADDQNKLWTNMKNSDA